MSAERSATTFIAREPSRRRGPARRGFVFLVVLLVFTIAVIMIAVSVQRATVQGAVVNTQINRYKQYHESLGVNDIIFTWINKPQTRDLLYDASRSDNIAYTFELPDGTLFAARIKDGQGTLLNRFDATQTPEMQQRLEDAALRLPADRRDLLRRYGPVAISLHAASDELLLAIAGGDRKLADLLASLRAQDQMDPARMTAVLNNSGYGSQASELTQLLTFTPMLWRVDVEVMENANTPIRRYRLVYESESGFMNPRECTIVPGDATDDLLNGASATAAGSRGTGTGAGRVKSATGSGAGGVNPKGAGTPGGTSR